MQVILTRDVQQLGVAGEQVKVKRGYARNFLIPRGLAKPATPSALRELEAEQVVLASLRARQRSAFEEAKVNIEQRVISIPMQAGEDGKLFGAVTNGHIADVLQALDITVDKRTIHLQDPITQLGDYRVPVHLHAEVIATATVSVVATP
jgi:large subunit ribosomal protein L9